MIKDAMRKRIRNLYYNSGLNKTEIARRTHLCFRTVAKIISETELGVEPKPMRKPRAKVSDIYENEILGILQDDKKNMRKQRHTAYQMFCELAKRHVNFNLSYSTVLRMYNKIYPTVFQYNQLTKNDDVAPGTMYVGTYSIDIKVDNNSESEKGCLLACVFPYSGFYYYQVFRSSSQENVLTGLFNVFKFIGGIPPIQYYPDNQIFFHKPNSSNGLCRTKGIFSSFCLQNHFTRYFANDDASKYKAHMALRKHTFIKTIMLGKLAVSSDIRSFNENLLQQCEKHNHVYNQKRKAFAYELFLQEKFNFNKIIDYDYEICYFGQKKAGHQSEMTIDKNVYILAPDYHDVYVLYKLFYDHIVFMNVEKDIIVEYPRKYGESGQVSVDWGLHLVTLAEKPGAYQNIDINRYMSKELDDYLRNSNIYVRRLYFTALRDVAKVASFQDGIAFLEELCKRDYHTPVRIDKMYQKCYGHLSRES